MKKEDVSRLFNSRDGKVNLALLFSIVLIFVLTLVSVEAISIRQLAPGNLTYNGTANRNVTFYFNVTVNCWNIHTLLLRAFANFFDHFFAADSKILPCITKLDMYANDRGHFISSWLIFFNNTAKARTDRPA